MACDNVLCIFTGELVSMTQKNAALIVEGLLTYSKDLYLQVTPFPAGVTSYNQMGSSQIARLCRATTGPPAA